jgi:hypothetical protein
MAISYDPRKAIQEKIGTSHFDFDLNETYYSIDITDNDGEIVEIPMYLNEKVKSGIQPTMPYIVMYRAHTMYDSGNPQSTTRDMDSYIDLKLMFTDTDNIVPYDFKKDIMDKLQTVIRTNQSITPGTWFYTITDERDEEYRDARQVVFTYILTIHATWADVC